MQKKLWVIMLLVVSGQMIAGWTSLSDSTDPFGADDTQTEEKVRQDEARRKAAQEAQEQQRQEELQQGQGAKRAQTNKVGFSPMLSKGREVSQAAGAPVAVPVAVPVGEPVTMLVDTPMPVATPVDAENQFQMNKDDALPDESQETQENRNVDPVRADAKIDDSLPAELTKEQQQYVQDLYQQKLGLDVTYEQLEKLQTELLSLGIINGDVSVATDDQLKKLSDESQTLLAKIGRAVIERQKELGNDLNFTFEEAKQTAREVIEKNKKEHPEVYQELEQSLQNQDIESRFGDSVPGYLFQILGNFGHLLLFGISLGTFSTPAGLDGVKALMAVVQGVLILSLTTIGFGLGGPIGAAGGLALAVALCTVMNMVAAHMDAPAKKATVAVQDFGVDIAAQRGAVFKESHTGTVPLQHSLQAQGALVAEPIHTAPNGQLTEKSIELVCAVMKDQGLPNVDKLQGALQSMAQQ